MLQFLRKLLFRFSKGSRAFCHFVSFLTQDAQLFGAHLSFLGFFRQQGFTFLQILTQCTHFLARLLQSGRFCGFILAQLCHFFRQSGFRTLRFLRLPQGIVKLLPDALNFQLIFTCPLFSLRHRLLPV